MRHLEEQVRRLSALEGRVKAQQGLSNASPLPSDDGAEPAPHYKSSSAQSSGAQDAGSPASSRSRQGAGQEVSGLNRHTRSVEFYGSSSSVALLSHVQRAGAGAEESAEETDGEALVSNLHNDAFSPAVDASLEVPQQRGCATHYPQCRPFLENYFTSLHYIHPFLDEADFMARCENLWSQKGDSLHGSSFAALYYSLLSLGALVGPRIDAIDGIGNLQWSRRFFDESISRCHRLGMVTDLDMVQCYFILVYPRCRPPTLALVTDPQSRQRYVRTNSTPTVRRPHAYKGYRGRKGQLMLTCLGSYMYTGLSVRTALAMGINREPSSTSNKSIRQLKAEARTWWYVFVMRSLTWLPRLGC